MTREEFEKKYRNNYEEECRTGEQWNGSGWAVDAIIWNTRDGYYLSLEMEDEDGAREFAKDDLGSEGDNMIEYTLAYCRKFGYKYLGRDEETASEAANTYIKDEFCTGPGFAPYEYGGICSY